MARDRHLELRILVVDDEPSNIELLTSILRKDGYTQVRTLLHAPDFSEAYREFAPDLVLLDLQMPHVTGFQILSELLTCTPSSSEVPVIVLTADVTKKSRAQALGLGARDFIIKPFDVEEVLLRVANHLEVRALYHSVEMRVEDRTREIAIKNQELDTSRIDTLRRLAKAAEFRDDDTGKHTLRVGLNSSLLAKELGMSGEFVRIIREAAPLHDVGKIGIPDSILLKPGKLTPEEWVVMKTHTTIGGDILAGSTAGVLQTAEQIARTHHEKWDGSGYEGLAGESIPLSGRIVAVADVFDALIQDRPYKKAWEVSRAAGEIVRCSGTHFDPQVVAAFGSIWRTLATGGVNSRDESITIF